MLNYRLFSRILFGSLFFLLSFSVQASFFQSAGETVDDSVITSKVKVLLAKDAEISPFKVSVSTNVGVVTLSGIVDTNHQFENIVSTVESVKGVRDIKTKNLRIQSSRNALKDTVITARVKGVILKHEIFCCKNLRNLPIKVTTKNSRVYLSGKVESDFIKSKLISAVKSMKSVKSVDAKDIVIG